jgi:hypothetical protein|tara:strand:+ start:154 stop:855 length:702 start_codon:yes stop_codon:yes gene_type:complete
MTTNFPNGITNADRGSEFEKLILPDPTQAHVYFNDFTTYVAGDWTITTTEGGTGNASEALTNVAGGALLITNDDADNDSDEFQLAVESFKFASGKKSWFKTRFKVSDATQSDWIVGLCITDTTIIDAVSDGVYFKKDDGDASIDFALELNGSATEASGIATQSDDTFVTLGWYFDGDTTNGIKYYVDGTHKGTQTTMTNLCTDEELAVSFALQNGAAAAKTMTLDYIYAAQER